MQRREAKNRPERPQGSPETEGVERYRAKIPTETTYRESAPGFAVSKDWMVVCAVGYEPVSTWNSLLSTVLQGNFRKMRGFAEFWSSIVLQFQSVTAKFPVHG